MNDLTIRKDRLQVLVHFTDGSKTAGEVFLAPFSGDHHGHQKVADLLETEDKFFPLSIEGGDVEFISKSQILMIEGELIGEEDRELLSAGLVHQVDVSVVITDACIIDGTLLAEVPPERSRLSDCLNLSGNYLRLRSENRYIHVNKSFIKKVLSRQS